MNNNRNVAVFLVTLVLLLGVYVSSSYKMAIYNHSGSTIETVRVESVWKNKTFTGLPDNEVLHITIFAPFRKQVRVRVKQAGLFRSVAFTLRFPFAGESNNQVEIRPDNTLVSGSLDLE